EAGTVLVKDIYIGNNSASVQSIINVNGVIYFLANDGIHGKELWKSDGTEAGTVLIKDIWTGIGSSEITSLIVAGDILIFTANDGMNGQEVWRSDGTAAGTMMVQDIVIPGASFPVEYTVV